MLLEFPVFSLESLIKLFGLEELELVSEEELSRQSALNRQILSQQTEKLLIALTLILQ